MKLIRFITIFFIAQLNISVFSDNIKIRENQTNPNFDKDKIEVFKRIVTRSLFGNINASRNSA